MSEIKKHDSAPESQPDAAPVLPKGKMPLLPIILFLFFVLSVLPGPLFFVGLFMRGPLEAPVTLIIPHGTSVQEITKILDENKILIHPILFRAAARLIAKNKLMAGEYKFEAGLSAVDVALILHNGQSVMRQFTVPEGLTSQEILFLLDEVEGLSGKVEEVPDEGSLMPETYRYTLDNSRKDIIERMQKDQRNVLSALWEKKQEGLPFNNQNEALVLASIVEKETGYKAEERARVAGVFINRLRLGMPLQSDPTVIYSITEGKGPLSRALLYKDLKKKSPYNTYENVGLPPKPICNPGRAAIEAVLAPEKNDYIYFVADGSGGHAFAKTLKEHNNNVATWKNLKKPQ